MTDIIIGLVVIIVPLTVMVSMWYYDKFGIPFTDHHRALRHRHRMISIRRDELIMRGLSDYQATQHAEIEIMHEAAQITANLKREGVER